MLFGAKLALAHSGRTDSLGCHNCYTGSCAGDYHCHNGGSVGSRYIPVTPVVVVPDFPKGVQATFEFKPNRDGKTFTVEMDWTEVTNTGHSITLKKFIGDPGPLTDTMSSKYAFYDVYPGKYYANMKMGINNVWSKSVYWEVNVPKWYSPRPSPSPTPVPIVTNTKVDESGDRDITLILLFLLAIGFGSLYLGVRFIRWILNYAKEHEWVYTVIFYGVLIFGIYIWSIFSNNSEKTSTNIKTHSKYSCNCSKTCPSLSCAEAQYQLNQCGCRQRDADRDGIACDSQCQ